MHKTHRRDNNQNSNKATELSTELKNVQKDLSVTKHMTPQNMSNFFITKKSLLKYKIIKKKHINYVFFRY